MTNNIILSSFEQQKIIRDDFLAKTADFSDQSDLINLKKFLDDPSYKSFITLRFMNDIFITNFNTNPNVEVIDYLFNSPTLPYHPEINYASQAALQQCLSNDNIEVFDYLLNCPQGKKHFNIHLNNDRIYNNICDAENLEFLTYLITSYNIEYTENMKYYHTIFINDPFYKKSLNLFSLRELNNKLNNCPNNNGITVKPIKKRKI